MKKTLLAIALALSVSAAQATTVVSGNFSLNYDETGFLFDGSHDVIDVAGSDITGGFFGQLSATNDVQFFVTFLGKEASNINFYVSNGVSQIAMGTDVVTVGQDFVFNTPAGVIDYGFTGTGLATGSNLDGGIGRIAYLPNDGFYKDRNGNMFDFLIGFNDGGSADGDYDDYVIGVSSVPVPAALPLMASALGAFGIARRRNKAKAA